MSTWRDVLIKAGKDSAYRDRLKANPAAAAAEAGVQTPKNVTVEVIEQGREDLHLVLGSRCGVAEIDRLLERAESDAELRRQLQADGRSAVESAIGQSLPPAAKIRVHENTANHIRLLLPAEPAAESELSDQELEAVAGGTLKGLLTRIGNAFCRDSTSSTYQQDEPGGFIYGATVTVNSSFSSTTTTY